MKREPTLPHLIVMAALMIAGLSLLLSAGAYIVWTIGWPTGGLLGGLSLLILAVAYVHVVNYLKS